MRWCNHRTGHMPPDPNPLIVFAESILHLNGHCQAKRVVLSERLGGGECIVRKSAPSVCVYGYEVVYELARDTSGRLSLSCNAHVYVLLCAVVPLSVWFNSFSCSLPSDVSNFLSS